MKEQVSVSMVQPELIWEDIDANLEMLRGMLDEAPLETDLIILPETFSTGFTMQSRKLSEPVDGKTLNWMQKVAAERKAYVTGSLIISDNGRIYNRLYWVSPDGIKGYYDKRHLFRMGREDEHFVSGKYRKIFNLGPIRFLPQICYDLRFPVFSRNRGDYDVLFYVANWPAPRQLVWESLIKARAIENQAYVIGVNRVGIDGLDVNHVGGSCAIDPLGNVMQWMDHKPGIRTISLDLGKVREFRKKFPAWKDADQFSINYQG